MRRLRIPAYDPNLGLRPKVARPPLVENSIPEEMAVGPDGSWYSDAIESALDLADQLGLRKNQRVDLVWHKRCRRFNRDHPEWENVGFSLRVDELRTLFLRMTGREYEPPHDHYQKIQAKHRPWYAGWPLTRQAREDIAEGYARALKGAGEGARVYPVKCWE